MIIFSIIKVGNQGQFMMKINDKLLSIPPYISTSWGYVKSLQMKGPFLMITLMGGESITIPNLKSDIIELIFSVHADFLEKNIHKATEQNMMTHSHQVINPDNSEMPFKLGLGSIDGIGNPLIHNPAQKDAVDIPKPILQKIAAIARIISPEDLIAMPKAEPGCNCLHCQIVRTINETIEPEHSHFIKQDTHQEKIEDEVKDEELVFQQWDVKQTGDNLFNVINRLDTQEKYSVYLGNPVGCTCGRSNCEHIIAVLKS